MSRLVFNLFQCLSVCVLTDQLTKHYNKFLLLLDGPSTIIQDERFVVRHGLLKEDDWALQIKNLDKSDAGLYQCQTSSEPLQSQYYQLNVVGKCGPYLHLSIAFLPSLCTSTSNNNNKPDNDHKLTSGSLSFVASHFHFHPVLSSILVAPAEPQVNILGAPDMAVKLGSAINLTCVISQSADQLQFVFWYRDNRMINYDMNERGKIVMSKGSGQKQLGQLQQQAHGDTITSNLQIFSSKLSDSGNYTCLPSGARPVSIYVHVLEGKYSSSSC